MVWVVQGGDAFAQGYLAGLKKTGTGRNISYAVKPAEDIVFDANSLVAELVISKRTPAYTGTGSNRTLKSITTVSSAGVYDVLFDDISVSGVGTITEVDNKPSDDASPLSVTATLPLSGTLLTE